MTSSFSIACASLASSLHNIDRELERDKRTSPEDQLKTPISTFLTELGKQRTRQVNVVTEHRQVAGDNVQGVRLDLGIKDGYGRLVGHIELKAPGKSANPFRQAGWSKHDKKQWKRLENHTNLIYTNGWEWTLLRHGSISSYCAYSLYPQIKTMICPKTRCSAYQIYLTSFYRGGLPRLRLLKGWRISSHR